MICKDIEGFEDYTIDTEGRVYSKISKRYLKSVKTKNGYMIINLKGTQKYIHRLVAEAFIPNANNRPEIDHIDTDRTNNKAENLRWVNRKENCNNPISIKHYSDKKVGKPAHNKKPVQQYSLKGDLIMTFNSITEAAIANNMRRTDISTVLIGRQKTSRGYKWKYKDN